MPEMNRDEWRTFLHEPARLAVPATVRRELRPRTYVEIGVRHGQSTTVARPAPLGMAPVGG